MRNPKIWFLSLLFLHICGACAYPIREDRLLYPRKSIPLPDTARRKSFVIALPEGEKLRGWHIPTPGARVNIVVFYGNAANLRGMEFVLTQWASLFGANMICADYRGYGISDGQPSLNAIRKDALPIFDQTASLRAGLPTIILGISIGTIAACHLAAERTVDGLVLLAPPSRFADVASAFGRSGPWYLRPFLLFVRPEPGFVIPKGSEPSDNIAKITAPLLIVHGDADKVVPLECGRKLHAAAASAWKQIVVIPGAGHNDLNLLTGPDRDAVSAYLEQILR